MNGSLFPLVGDAKRAPIRKLDLTGKERQLRLAVEVMGRIAGEFARSARRCLPFLSRYKSQLVPGLVQSLQSSLESDLEQPTFEATIGTADGLGWASVTLDANAIAFVLEGALGGSGAFWETSVDPALTSAQRALLTRLTASLASELAAQILREVGLSMSALGGPGAPPATSPEAGDVLRVACKIEGLPVNASVVVSASAQALEHAAKEQDAAPEPVQGDPRVVDALLEVPMELRAELGRVSLGLKRVLMLRPGDVIHLKTATDDALRVTIAGVEKFCGVPVVSRGQLSIEVRDRHKT
ncbi:MAG TPA: FliM/FliN family flagellar motor switch protein [Polyangiaceae bacterium]|nr:FliM/FliN family flagellar motor switch protein [Polyangiaceae bacterium]